MFTRTKLLMGGWSGVCGVECGTVVDAPSAALSHNYVKEWRRSRASCLSLIICRWGAGYCKKQTFSHLRHIYSGLIKRGESVLILMMMWREGCPWISFHHSNYYDLMGENGKISKRRCGGDHPDGFCVLRLAPFARQWHICQCRDIKYTSFNIYSPLSTHTSSIRYRKLWISHVMIPIHDYDLHMCTRYTHKNIKSAFHVLRRSVQALVA